MEKDVEARLREKYALIDKNDVEQLAEAQKVKYIRFIFKLILTMAYFYLLRLA